jgi:DDE superfamily endonuclease
MDGFATVAMLCLIHKGKPKPKALQRKGINLLTNRCSTLQLYRHEIYHCFQRAKAALFDTVDALLAETQAQSFPQLSQSPFFQRKWPSLYEAFEDGLINTERLRETFVKYRQLAHGRKRMVVGIDATPIPRPESCTSADRTTMPMHNIPHSRPKKSTALTFGWKYSTVMVLPEKPSSWTTIVDQQRISSDTTDIQVAFEQLQRLVPLFSTRLLVLLDRGYDCNWLWCRCSGLPIDLLGRLKGNRCFYKPAPAHTGKSGQPRKDGAKLKLSDSSTQSHPDHSWEGTDAKEHAVRICWWEHMHVKEARWLDVTIIQVSRPHATNSERDPRISWFVYQGQDPQEGLAQIALLYGLRFCQEHGYRFDKQALLWTEPRLRTPEQFDRWSQVVAIVHNLIAFAREFIAPELHPWENKQRDPTPQQVRRGLAKFLPQLGTPASPPKPRGNPKGRKKGDVVRKATRFPVVRKTAKVPQLVPT